MQSNDRVSTTAAEGGRKSSKPIMEKRRRARINASLAELKSLLLEAIRKEGARHNKMEKADILEMAVKHLRQIQRQQFTGEAARSTSPTAKYQLGFQACAQEVSKYLGSTSDEEVELKTKLLNHLANCITSDAFPQPQGPSSSDNVGTLEVSPSASASSPPSSSSSASPSDPSSLVVQTTSSGMLISPQFLSSSSSAFSSSSSSANPAASSILIPIPISPLSLGSVSPASSATSSPEKSSRSSSDGSKFITQCATQIQADSGSNIYREAAATLDLSGVKISDSGLFKPGLSLFQTPNGFQTAMDTTVPQIPQAISLLSTNSVPVNVNRSRPSEINNNVEGNQVSFLDQVGLQTVLETSSEDRNSNDNSTAANNNGVQLRVHQGIAEVNNNNIPSSTTTATNNNSNNNNGNSSTLTVPAFVGVGSTTNNIAHLSQQILQLQQPQILQLLQQQRLHSQPSEEEQQQRQQLQQQQQQSQIQPTNSHLLDRSTGVLANMNQLQLIPTKTASGEIAFLLSTGVLNPAPFTLNTVPQTNFAVPLQIQPASKSSPAEAMPPPPAPPARFVAELPSQPPEDSSKNKTEHHHRQEQHLQSHQINSNSPLKAPRENHRSEGASLQDPTGLPSHDATSEEDEQLAPLNLSSPERKQSSFRSPPYTTRGLNRSPPLCLRPAPFPANSHKDRTVSPSSLVPSAYYDLASSSTSRTGLPIQNSQPEHLRHCVDRDRAFSEGSIPRPSHTSSFNSTRFRPDLHTAVDVQRADLASSLHQTPLAASSLHQTTSVAFVKPGLHDDNASAIPPRNGAAVGSSSSSPQQETLVNSSLRASRYGSISPPAAHSSRWEQDRGAVAGHLEADQSWPHNSAGKSLFRPW